MISRQQFIEWVPCYAVLVSDKSNFTPLGFMLLYIPWFLLSIMLTISMYLTGVVILILVLPLAGAGWCLGQLEERYAINNKLETGMCKLVTGLKLLRRC